MIVKVIMIDEITKKITIEDSECYNTKEENKISNIINEALKMFLISY